MGSVEHSVLAARAIRSTLTAVCFALASVFAAPLGAQSAQELFQRALTLERSHGNLSDAIVLYRRVVADAGPNRALAARALIRLGQAYEVLGRDEARSAYERVIRDFADQPDFVRQARRRLAALGASTSASAQSRAPAARVVFYGKEVNQTSPPSPDRRFTSYTDWATGDLAIRDLVTGQHRRLTKDGASGTRAAFADMEAVFSHDSRQIAYAWWTTHGADSASGGNELRTIRVEGGAPHIIASMGNAYVRPFAWTPKADGVLVAIDDPSGDAYLAIVRMSDGHIQRVIALDACWITNASLSADGRWVVYDPCAGTEAQQRDIHIVATDGSRHSVLVRHDANDWHPMWTPAGDAVVFYSDRSGTWRAWRVEVDQGLARDAAEPLSPNMSGYRPLGFTRDSAFWYIPAHEGSEIGVAGIESVSSHLREPAAQLTRTLIDDSEVPDWSPDGRSIVFISLLGGSGEQPAVVMVNRETGVQQELTPPLVQYRRPRWSPDGRSLLLSGLQHDTRAGWFRVDVETGDVSTIRLMDDASGTAQRTEWSADGRSIYYALGDATNVAALRRYDIAAGKDTMLYRDTASRNILDLAPSPDGEWLAFTVSETHGGRRRTRLLSLRRGTVRALSSARAYTNLNWTPDSRALLCVFSRNTPPAPAQLWRVPIDGARPEMIDLGVHGFTSFRVDRAGRRVAFVVPPPSEREANLWVMENLLPRASKPH